MAAMIGRVCVLACGRSRCALLVQGVAMAVIIASEVLAEHAGTIRVLHTIRPFAVVMAGAGEFDPYKD
jgi:hypothetical protein